MILPLLLAAAVQAQPLDYAINNGRLIDPASNTDAIRSVGIRGGQIASVSAKPPTAKTVIDATGLVIAPGFIDLHSHGQDAENYAAKAMDGVTSALECEIGVADVDAWYAARAGKSLIHYGATAGHVPARMKVMGDKGSFLPADNAAHRKSTAEEVTEMSRIVERGLREGAVGVGFGIMYTPAASAAEYLAMFRIAARFKVPAFVHVNYGLEGLNEAIGYAATAGCPLHIVHLNSSGGRTNTPNFLASIADARKNGLDVTTECYPYTAGQTNIASAIYDDGWQKRMGIDYKDLLWTATGERLTVESFARYRKAGGSVIAFSNTEEMVERAVASPLTMIASDGILREGKGHPRSTGAYARILGTYVRERRTLTLAEAIRKMTIMPAQRLEARVPAMRAKGRIAAGADADIAVFDPRMVTDRSDYVNPARHSEGFRYVFASGRPVVNNGRLDASANPGQPIRAPR